MRRSAETPHVGKTGRRRGDRLVGVGRRWTAAAAVLLLAAALGFWSSVALRARPSLQAARASGDAERGLLLMGQDAGLVDAIEPAAALVARLAAEAETALRERARELLRGAAPTYR